MASIYDDILATVPADTWAAIRTLTPQWQKYTGDNETRNPEERLIRDAGGQWALDQDALAPLGYQSKFNELTKNPDGTYQAFLQKPGGDKYDMLVANYKQDPTTNQLGMQGEPEEWRRPSSWVKGRDQFRSTIEHGVPFVGAVLGGAYLANGALAGEALAGGATEGAVNLGTLGQATAADYGMMVGADGLATYGGIGAAEAMGAAAAGGAGATAFPVAAQAADVTTQLAPNLLSPEVAATAAGPGLTVPGGAAPSGAVGPGMTVPSSMSGPVTSLANTGLGPAAGSAPFDWSSLLSGKGIRSGIDTLSGLYGMKLAGDAREASDPFAQYRPGYGQQLAALEANPNLITQRPGWLAGTELINRQMASRGYTGSGNQAAALQRYAGDFYNAEANRLATLAGAGQTPGAGQIASAQLASQSLGSIGYGIAPWLPGKP